MRCAFSRIPEYRSGCSTARRARRLLRAEQTALTARWRSSTSGSMRDYIGRGLGRRCFRRRGARLVARCHPRVAAHLHARLSGSAAELSRARIREVREEEYEVPRVSDERCACAQSTINTLLRASRYRVAGVPRSAASASLPSAALPARHLPPRRRAASASFALTVLTRDRGAALALEDAPARAPAPPRPASTGARAAPAARRASRRAPTRARHDARRSAADGRASAARSRAACARSSREAAAARRRPSRPIIGRSSTSYSIGTS